MNLKVNEDEINQRLKERVKKCKSLVRGLKEKNKFLQDKSHIVGDKRAKLMIRFTKACRFAQKLKKINAKFSGKKDIGNMNAYNKGR